MDPIISQWDPLDPFLNNACESGQGFIKNKSYEGSVNTEQSLSVYKSEY